MSDRFARLRGELAALGRGGAKDAARAPTPWRQAAVQVLLADAGEPDVTFIERSAGLRRHAGQIAFPGGAREPGDASLIATAQRETFEEIGLAPDAIDVIGVLSPDTVRASGFDVTAVIGVWSGEEPLAAEPAFEVARVIRRTVGELADPANRVLARLRGVPIGPAFRLDDVFIWGFTARATSLLLELGGWARPWARRVVDVPDRYSSQ